MRHVEQGYKLETHADVPEEIRQQLYAEEQQRLEERQKVEYQKACDAALEEGLCLWDREGKMSMQELRLKWFSKVTYDDNSSKSVFFE